MGVLVEIRHHCHVHHIERIAVAKVVFEVCRKGAHNVVGWYLNFDVIFIISRDIVSLGSLVHDETSRVKLWCRYIFWVVGLELGEVQGGHSA